MEFLYGTAINLNIERIIENAENHLILICPYFNLHHRLKEVLRKKKNDHELVIKILFGKNENNKIKSLSNEDFKFLKEFPNITIKYSGMLHAKYYANDFASLITSMNLLEFSQNNNIEAGIFIESKAGISSRLFNKNDVEITAWNYFCDIFDQAEEVFCKEPVYEKSGGLINGFLGKENFKNAKIRYDHSYNFFNGNESNYNTTHKGNEPNFVPHKFDSPRSTQTYNYMQKGYCIRTGKLIDFNPERPFSYEAYQTWSQFGDGNYPERFCHFSGEESFGENCSNFPILKRNWNKAKKHIN